MQQSLDNVDYQGFEYFWMFLVWSHLGLNQGLPDYESGALTNWAIGPRICECKITTIFFIFQIFLVIFFFKY